MLNNFAGLVNTDCYFGPDWLQALVEHAHQDLVVNSLHITAATPPKPVRGIFTENLGPPIRGQFNSNRFYVLYRELRGDCLWLAQEDYRQAATMPYLFHRKWWEQCGPWELKCVAGQSPDVRFFDRVHDAGAKYALALGSVVYHHEAVERRGKRPVGAENLPEE